ncbi:condensin complex subunit 2-domain-containing protein [Blastocladiella britannica]|nr:condensin complex subunit 2-domain-containing protein [Blastocladiella britannica]
MGSSRRHHAAMRPTSPTRRPTGPLVAPATPSTIASATQLVTGAHRRKSMRSRTTPKSNEKLRAIASAVTTGRGGEGTTTSSSSALVGRTPEEISASYEQWMKLAADNKINAANSWQVGLIDYFADMSILRGDHAGPSLGTAGTAGGRDGDINFQKASCTLDGCVKIFSTRVDAVASETELLVSGLNDAKQAAALDHAATGNNSDDDDENDDADGKQSQAARDLREKKRRQRKANARTLEPTFAPITTATYDIEFMVDPLFRKTCAEFDEGGAKSLLFNRLPISCRGEYIFDASDVSFETGLPVGDSVNAADTDLADDAMAVDPPMVDLSGFKFLPTLQSIDWSTKTVCPTLSSFVFSDELRGVESLTQTLELDLMDELTHGPAFDEDPLEPHLIPVPGSASATSGAAHEGGPNVSTDDYVPMTLPPSDDYYITEANALTDNDYDAFDDDHDDDGRDYGASGAVFPNTYGGNGTGDGATAPTGIFGPLADDSAAVPPSSLLPLPRPTGVLGAQAIADARRAAALAAARQRRGTAGPGATRRSPPPGIDFFGPAVDMDALFAAKGGAAANLPKTTAATASSPVGTREMHVVKTPFDPFALVALSLKPAATAPLAVARSLTHAVRAWHEMVPGLMAAEARERASGTATGGNQESQALDDDDDGGDDGGGADWAVEAPVGNGGYSDDDDDDDDMDMSRHTELRPLDPVVAEDMRARGLLAGESMAFDDTTMMMPEQFSMDMGGESMPPPPPMAHADSQDLMDSSVILSNPHHDNEVPPPLPSLPPHDTSRQSMSALMDMSMLPPPPPAPAVYRPLGGIARRNRLQLKFAKRSKRVDVKKLKDNIWRMIRRRIGARGAAGTGQEDVNDENTASAMDVDGTDKAAPMADMGAFPLHFQGLVRAVGDEYAADQFKDISVPFCFICLLHLANEKGLQLDAQGMQDVAVRSVGGGDDESLAT